MSKGQKFGYEKRDINLSAIGKLVVGLFAFIIVSLVAMKLLFATFLHVQVANEKPSPPMASQQSPPTEPRLEIYEGEVIDAVRAYEKPLLQEYSWVDQSGGFARIPIERAMELLAKREMQP